LQNRMTRAAPGTRGGDEHRGVEHDVGHCLKMASIG
jgi:hypothetical protein